MNLKQLLVILLSIVFSNAFSQDNTRIKIESIKLNADTIISKKLKDYVLNKNIDILEYSKIKYTDADVVDERMVLIDYSSENNLKLELSKTINKLNSDLEKGNYYPQIDLDKVDGNLNIDDFQGVYVELKRLKSSDILFEYDIYYPMVISEGLIAESDMEGWNLSIIKKSNNIENGIDLELNDISGARDRKVKLRPISKDTYLLLETGSLDNGEGYEYRKIVVPLKKAKQLPILRIINTGELDDIYDGFDEVDFKSYSFDK
ncbi:hypothetical protein MY04_1216 [Flammeovirga sp. MY04]|uniref:hypothetical protein n=1 Tax=Flammeovirga sp. MY04 TaxID=1191459 RepID=UPI0008062AF8|nr:hypothetical protein [Flammeovirga sp. MY04]ANQ48593.1 hypothetical protein MY04_1216 [Flammeovirga sp. MY04]